MSAVASPAIVLGSSESFVDSVVKVAGVFKKMSSDKLMKKIQGLEETLESLRQQLVQSRSEDLKPATKKEKVQKQKQEKETKTSATVAVAEEKEKEKVPMPWTGLVDFATCVGLKAQYGLFLQCGKTCDPKSRVFTIDNHDCRFCSDCVKKCDEQGNHPVGTMDQRIEAGVGKYVNAKTGKKETLYIDALEKMGITKEEALAAAEKRGFQIPDWMLEKAEKKRGRPSSKNVGGGDGSASSENGSDAEKKPKQQIKKVKKTASAITTDTPQKMIPDSAESASLVDTADAADAHEKKKRGRPAKTITKKNVAESEMQQLIVQATAEKKKRLSFGPDIYTPLATTTTTTVVEPAFHGDSASEQTGIAVNINFDEIADEDGFINFDNFGDQEDNNDNNQDQKEEQEQEQVDVAAVAVAAVAALPSLAGKVGGGNHPSHPDCAASALNVAVEKKNDKSEKKESKKKESKKKDSEKKESKKKDKSEKKEKKESEKKKEPEPEKKKEEVVVDEEEEEELECEEYEYEGETYGLAPNGDIYSQDGDLVGKVTDGVTKMFN